MGTPYDDIVGETLVTKRQAAEILKKSYSTVHRMCQSHILEVRRRPRNRTVFVTLSSVERYQLLNETTQDRLIAEVVRLKRRMDLVEKKLASSGTTVETLMDHNPAAIRALLLNKHGNKS